MLDWEIRAAPSAGFFKSRFVCIGLILRQMAGVPVLGVHPVVACETDRPGCGGTVTDSDGPDSTGAFGFTDYSHIAVTNRIIEFDLRKRNYKNDL